MKKLLLGLVALAMALAFVSCKKDAEVPENAWQIGSIWWNEVEGEDAKVFFSEEEITAAGEDPESFYPFSVAYIRNPGFTKVTNLSVYSLPSGEKTYENTEEYTLKNGTIVNETYGMFNDIVFVYGPENASLTQRDTDNEKAVFTFDDGSTLTLYDFYDPTTIRDPEGGR